MPGQWTKVEDIRYYFFLILSFHRFYPKLKKTDNVFKQMSGFLRTKNSTQCLSHHQKKCGKKNLILVLSEFYSQNYQIRYIDIKHSMREFQDYLVRINPTFLTDLRSNAQSEITLELILSKFQANWHFILQNRSGVISQSEPTTLTISSKEIGIQTENANIRQNESEMFPSILKDDSLEQNQLSSFDPFYCRDSLQQ